MTPHQRSILASDPHLSERLAESKIGFREYFNALAVGFVAALGAGVVSIFIVGPAAVAVSLICGVVATVLVLQNEKQKRVAECESQAKRFFQAVDDIQSNTPHSHEHGREGDFYVVRIRDTVKTAVRRPPEVPSWAVELHRSERNAWRMTPATADRLQLVEKSAPAKLATKRPQPKV